MHRNISVWACLPWLAVATACAGGSPEEPTGSAAQPLVVVEASFNAGSEGFTYADDVFGTNAPSAASGSASGGQLNVTLGQSPNSGANSGGWSTTFSGSGVASISFDYNMNQHIEFEPAECAEVRVTVDGVSYAANGNPYIVQRCGGGTASGTFSFDTASLPAGNHTLTIGGYLNSNSYADEIVNLSFDNVLVDIGGGSEPSGSGAFLESGGMVVMEAESFTENTPRGSHSWTAQSGNGASGTALVASPNSGAAINTGYVTSSPELEFEVDFTETGTYSVWVRGRDTGPGQGAGDSVHAGIDGTGPSSADRISGFSGSFGWTRSTMDGQNATLVVSSPGVHSIHFWMREDGFAFDKVVLTKNTGFTPTGTGPAESARDTGDVGCGDSVCGAGEDCSSCPGDCGGCSSATSLDIGSVGLTGSTSFADGTYTIQGAGTDIEGTSDAFRFVHETLQGDGQVTAFIEDFTSPNTWAKVGVMLREGTATGARNALFGLRPADGSFFQHRAQANSATVSSWQQNPTPDRHSIVPTAYGVRYLRAPKWLKLVRQGSTVTAYSSDDGVCWVDRWQQSIPFASSSLLAGVAVSSNNPQNLATATASNLTVSQGVPADVNHACARAQEDGPLAAPSTWVVPPASAGGSSWSYTTNNPNPVTRPASCLEGSGWDRRRTSPDDPMCPAETLPTGSWGHASYNPTGWSTGNAGFGPAGAQNVSTSISSNVVWLRKVVSLSSSQIANLMFWGRFSDSVSIYVNGVLATSTFETSWPLHEQYMHLGLNDAARAALTPGNNVIAVRAECKNCGTVQIDLGLGLNPPLAQLPRSIYATSAKFQPWGDAIYQATQELGALGAVFAVNQNGNRAGWESIGWMDRSMQTPMHQNAVLRLASVDKAVTQVALIRAYELGLLHPDETVFGDVLDLDPIPGGSVGARVGQITVDMLRLHTSLISSIGGLQPWQDEVAFRFGITADQLNKHHLARVLYSQPTECIWIDVNGVQTLECDPGQAGQYSSNGYFLIRYIIEQRLPNNQTFEQFLANDMGATDIVVAYERLAGRHPNEPGYNILHGETHSRWFELEEYLALSASAPGMVDFFNQNAVGYDRVGTSTTFIPRSDGGGGAMDGTRSGINVSLEEGFAVNFIWNSDLPGSKRLEDRLAALQHDLGPGTCDPRTQLDSEFLINSGWGAFPSHYLNVENLNNQNPSLDVRFSEVEPHWYSARWRFEAVQAGGTTYYVIRNAWQPQHALHIQSGTLEASAFDPSWTTAHWALEDSGSYFRISNRADPSRYIHVEGGVLQASAAPSGWHSSYWYLCN